MNRQCWVTAENQPLSKFCSKSGKWVVHNSGLHLFSADLVTTHGDWSCTWRPSWENNEFCDELRSLRRRQRSRKLWPRLRGGTRRRLMQRILSLFVLHNPPRELEQEAGIEVSCRWFRSSGRCTTATLWIAAFSKLESSLDVQTEFQYGFGCLWLVYFENDKFLEFIFHISS